MCREDMAEAEARQCERQRIKESYLASKQHLNHGAVWVACIYIMATAGRRRMMQSRGTHGDENAP
jgi:hypothetical protein